MRAGSSSGLRNAGLISLRSDLGQPRHSDNRHDKDGNRTTSNPSCGELEHRTRLATRRDKGIPDRCECRPDLLQECDYNRRTGNGEVAMELARQLEMHCPFGIEFQELAQGSRASPAFHGQATLSRWPLAWSRNPSLPLAVEIPAPTLVDTTRSCISEKAGRENSTRHFRRCGEA